MHIHIHMKVIFCIYEDEDADDYNAYNLFYNLYNI